MGNNSSVPVFQLIRTMCLCCFLLALSCVFEEGTFFEVTRMREAAGLAKKEKRLLAFLVGLRCARKLWCDRGAFKISYYIFFFPCTTENIKLLPHLVQLRFVVNRCQLLHVQSLGRPQERETGEEEGGFLWVCVRGVLSVNYCSEASNPAECFHL